MFVRLRLTLSENIARQFQRGGTMTEQGPGEAVVIGGGTMGAGIAAVFCAGNWTTHVVETVEATATTLPQRVSACLQQMGKAGGEKNLSVNTELGSLPWEEVSVVLECVSEDLALKKKIFASVEKLCLPETPITSNSSSYPISEIGQGLASQHRMAGLHFFMPAHLIPLVEVVSSKETSRETADYLCGLMTSLNKHPVWVKKDIPGFLANRIQHALMREAIYMVEQGIASPEDVDAAVRLSFGVRYVGAGPLLQKDFSGLDVQYSAAERIYPDLCNSIEPSPYLKNLVNANQIGVKTHKGFYEWNDDKIEVDKKRYETSLIQALAIIKNN